MSNNPPSLKALAEVKTVGITKTTSFRIDPELIEVEEGFNLRLENEELDAYDERLYEAMKGGAFIPAVDVQVVDGRVIARDGHRRRKAAIRLKAEIPDYTLECRQLRGNDSDALFHMLGTGGGSKPLTPLEQGIGFLRATRMGFTSPQIAAKLGITRVTVDNGITLAEAPMEVQQMVASGEVSSTVAREVVKEGTAAVEALKEAVKQNRAKPAKKGKKGKKGKVTAASLAGTAAEKKPGTGKRGRPPGSKNKGSGEEPTADNVAPLVIPQNMVTLNIDRDAALVTLELLKSWSDGDINLRNMEVALESALM